jgi:hypothetical protein
VGLVTAPRLSKNGENKMTESELTIFLILEELELIKASDIKSSRTNLNGVLNFCRDINGEEEDDR